MLKDAALLQLRVTRQALAAGLALKDATPYNVQWRGARPVFIDIGSFERARPGEPWLGYRQFCMLFLYPLLLESYRGIPFQPWLRGSLEGIHPAGGEVAAPGRDTFRGGVFKHVALHAKLERSHADGAKDVRKELRDAGFAKELIDANLKGLQKLVAGLEPDGGADRVERLRDDLQLHGRGHARKEEFVRAAVRGDLARSSGTWAATTAGTRGSRRRAPRTRSRSTPTTASSTASTATSIRRAEGTPFRSSVTSRTRHRGSGGGDSSGYRWWNVAPRSRPRARTRPPPDDQTTIPLRELVDWLAELGGELVIEFPDRDDVMVKRLLARKREGSHPDYNRGAFEDSSASASDRGVRRASLGTRALYHAAPRR